LKKQITREYKLLSGSAENISNIELATLFFLRAADLYLKDGGTIGFVLPRSVFTSDQHHNFRRSYFLNLGFSQVWDLEKVEPLFNVPACVFFATKGAETKYPLSCETFSGKKLRRKNASLEEANQALTVTPEELFLTQKGKRSFLTTSKTLTTPGGSFYRPHFKRGADIYPRPFWFMEIKPHPIFGFDPSSPYVQTAARAVREAKKAYKELRLEGNIERDFLYATLLSTDIVPFGHRDFRLVVLPLLKSDSGFQILKADEARRQGFLNLANWLEKAQKEWQLRRGEKAERMAVQEWLDYRGKLSSQRRAKYKVLYPTSATYLCSCVVEDKPISLEIAGQRVKMQGFLADIEAYYYDTGNKEEAYYLATILNSPVVDELIKPMQARGLWGPRHIHKKVLEIPIPKYNPSDENHRALSQLGERCTQKVKQLLPQKAKYQGISYLRKIIKSELKEELAQIDALVRQVLGSD
jgi:hypothetical protein